MPVARQPTQVRRENRIEGADALEPPADGLASPRCGRELRRVFGTDPLIGANVDHYCGSVTAPDEVIRRVANRTFLVVLPAQPERLRRNRDDIRVGVQQYQPIMLQPGFVTDMLMAGGEVPKSREAALTTAGGESTDLAASLERCVPAGQQRLSTANAVSIDEGQLESLAVDCRRQGPGSVHPSTALCASRRSPRVPGNLVCQRQGANRPAERTIHPADEFAARCRLQIDLMIDRSMGRTDVLRQLDQIV